MKGTNDQDDQSLNNEDNNQDPNNRENSDKTEDQASDIKKDLPEDRNKKEDKEWLQKEDQSNTEEEKESKYPDTSPIINNDSTLNGAVPDNKIPDKEDTLDLTAISRQKMEESGTIPPKKPSLDINTGGNKRNNNTQKFFSRRCFFCMNCLFLRLYVYCIIT
ncbi:MAG: hypothetical protein GXP45_06490, partial [bacterium]|nr:hypothetical protein [bacterium]